MIFGPDSMEITYISTGNIIVKGAANHASKAYEFSHFLQFFRTNAFLATIERGGKKIPSTSFVVYTSIVEPIVLVYEIEIQGDSDPDLVPTPKRVARKITENPSDTHKLQKENLVLCHAERCNKPPVICFMERPY